jgi:hypothetical protein
LIGDGVFDICRECTSYMTCSESYTSLY